VHGLNIKAQVKSKINLKSSKSTTAIPPLTTMSHLSNPLATAEQLYQKTSTNALPIELQDSIRFYTARLTQAAGILLRLPQDITAQANVLLFRYWLIDDLLSHEFSVFLSPLPSIFQAKKPPQDVSAATLYVTAKTSASPRSLRSITNVYAYLLSPTPSDSESYYLSESSYISFRNRVLNIEGHVLNALGFNTHVALPHPLAITYLQTLDAFGLPGNKGKDVAKRTIEYLNSALLSPQMLYLTHQPASLATAAIYLAAREIGVKMPEVEWWEVFDCEREELGFLVVGMGSLEGVARRGRGVWGEKWWVSRQDVRGELVRLGVGVRNGGQVEDEEAEMARLLDEKVADA
jgi:cyclin L